MKLLAYPWVCLILCILPSLLSRGQTITEARPYGDSQWLEDFLCSEIIYPAKSFKEGTEGTVKLSFYVMRDGEVRNLRVVQSVDPEIDAEAIRVFRMLIWEPAKRLGRPIDSERDFSFDFNIKKYKRACKKRGYEEIKYPFEPVDSSFVIYDIKAVNKRPYPVFDKEDMTYSRFIKENIQYPDAAFKQNITGKVALRFVVEPHGKISNLQVIKPLGGGCTQEAIRLVKMLNWMPGIVDGKAVRTSMDLEITFKLSDDTEHEMFDNNQMNTL